MDIKAVIVIFSVVILLSLSNQSLHGVEANRLLLQDSDEEIDRQLKILNKPLIKSIQTQVGDIFDCIDIYKQPAFDHPLLKNHKLQNDISLYDAKIPKTMLEIHSEKFPSGTVPIRRTTRRDLVNAKYHTEMRNSYRTNTYPMLQLQQDQFSTAQIWVQNGLDEDINSLEFGWTVYPGLYGDNRTRIFSYWTADGYKTTGCFNVNCPGFVQVHSTIALGDALDNFSEYGGTQHLANVMINRNPVSGNWWLLGNDNTAIGYWPKEIFTRLDKASVVRYGGEAGANPNSPIPPMGNGHFPDKDYSKPAVMNK
ncbi:hypothetical protein MKX01_004106 [Papaver californicum]|nr:hypothetical protein MKX01_004106 [Papaver californicum]